MQVPARALQQPVVDQFGLVGGGVVEDEVDVEVCRHARLDLIEKGAELDRTMPGRTAADHGPRLHVEGSEQIGRALAAIVVGPALGLAGPHRQHGGRAGQRLDLRFLIDAQHHGAVGRGHVQADDITHLVDEGGIGRQLEGLGPVRLQAEGAPDPRDHGLAHSDPLRHGARRPVGGVLRLAFQGQRDHRLDRSVLDGTRRTGAGQVDEAVEAVGEEASAPGRDARTADPEAAGDAGVRGAGLGAGQNDPGALGQRLTDLAAADQAFQPRALIFGQIKLGRLGTTGHRRNLLADVR